MLTGKKLKITLIALVITSIILIAVGLGLLLGGCGGIVEGSCGDYDHHKFQISSHYSKRKECDKCDDRDSSCYGERYCRKSCKTYKKYDCYDSYAKGFYLDKNKNQKECNVRAGDGYENEKDGYDLAIGVYVMGKKYGLKYKKNDEDCYDQDLTGQAIAGVILIGISGVCLIVALVLWFINYRKKKTSPGNQGTPEQVYEDINKVQMDIETPKKVIDIDREGINDHKPATPNEVIAYRKNQLDLEKE